MPVVVWAATVRYLSTWRTGTTCRMVIYAPETVDDDHNTEDRRFSTDGDRLRGIDPEFDGGLRATSYTATDRRCRSRAAW